MSLRLKGFIWNLAYISGLLFLLERIKSKPADKGIIFFYHRIHPNFKSDFWNLSIPPSLFQRQLFLIQKKGSFVGLREFLEPSQKRPSSSRTPQIVLTFDDGYRDVIDYAWPIMRSLSIVPHLFVCTDPLLRGIPLIWDLLARAVQDFPRKEIHFRDSSGQVRSFLLQNDTDKRICVDQLNQTLLGVSRKKLKKALDDLFLSLEKISTADLAGMYLNLDQARICLQEGIEIGAHTVSHPYLTKIPNTEWEQEIRGSKNRT